MEIVSGASNISTDEKKKILLARVLYSESDIVLLDSCFDEWNPILAYRIFRKIMSTALQGKTVLYSTTNNALISKSDLILYFEDGHIIQQGRYPFLLSKPNGPFFKLVIGDKCKNWRRQALSKILEGIVPIDR